MKQMLARSIHLAERLIKASGYFGSFIQPVNFYSIFGINSITKDLVRILQDAAGANNIFYERPTRRIVNNTKKVLEKIIALVLKFDCNSDCMRSILSMMVNDNDIDDAIAIFVKACRQLDSLKSDFLWLLRVFSDRDNHDHECLGGFPNITNCEPILGFIWQLIAILCSGSPEECSNAAASLVMLVQDNHRNGTFIIQEGGVGPLLKLPKEGTKEGQENASTLLALLSTRILSI